MKGRNRHILTDAEGFLVAALVHAADIQDRDGAPAVLAEARYRFPWLRHIFADGGYAGENLRSALRKMGTWNLEIIRRSDRARDFKVLPGQWVALRTLAWSGRSRRLATDWEHTLESAIAWRFITNIRLVTLGGR